MSYFARFVRLFALAVDFARFLFVCVGFVAPFPSFSLRKLPKTVDFSVNLCYNLFATTN
jgi:hypothetical protein